MDKLNKLNKNRRELIKFLLLGSGAFLAGKVFGSRILDFFTGGDVKVEQDFGNFTVSEDKKELIISDRSGENILIIDKR